MSTRMHSSIALLGIVLAGAWTAACGGGTATEMVSSPEVAVGAAIQGKVSVASGSGGQAFGFEAGLASSAVRVSVVGTDRSTTTDTQGRFALTGLSAGQVTLRFQATGVDARLSLGGLVEGQVLTIDVNVSGSDASLVSGDRGDDDDDDQAGEVEFEGVIESLTPPSLVVAGRSVLTDSSTEFKGKGSIDSIEDLSVGDLVEVEGVESTTGSVLAREIKRVEEAGDEDDDDDEDEDEDDDEDDDDDDDEDDDDDDDDNSGSGS